MQPSTIDAFLQENYGPGSMSLYDTLGGALLSAVCIELVVLLLVSLPLLVVVAISHTATRFGR
jgi:hypothetical protein